MNPKDTIIKEDQAREFLFNFWRDYSRLGADRDDVIETYTNQLAALFTTAYNSRQSEIDAAREEGRLQGIKETHEYFETNPNIKGFEGFNEALSILDTLSATKTPEV